ncbi:hypothetical protein D9611_010646 [Ephemerocybe angulata]|uniref:Uncharacterized protein n=2 Tax=Ephemerocybe angulata TaxID=980116 RepID=A0A8H6MH05_9AGAR|nr:hypothetical protein D9611_010646 [Tulosesus angulatus]KAF6764492.1 hypothetical protein DFP72DRAFT_872040 [Tulosesus angulatus]
MSSPPPTIIVSEFKDDEKHEVILSEKAQLESMTDIKAPLLPSSTLPPVISVPGANTVVTRLRYSLVILNIVIPVLLETTNIIPSAPWMSIIAVILAIFAYFQLNRQIANGKKIATELTVKGDAETIAAGNTVVMRALRLEILSGWAGFAAWIFATLMWVAVVVVSPGVNRTYVAVVVLSAVEATMCAVVAVLMTRYRRTALEQLGVRAPSLA